MSAGDGSGVGGAGWWRGRLTAGSAVAGLTGSAVGMETAVALEVEAAIAAGDEEGVLVSSAQRRRGHFGTSRAGAGAGDL